MSGAERIAAERRRQVEEEGWTAEHDEMHVRGELALAAVCYAAPERVYVERRTELGAVSFIDPWPFRPLPHARGHTDWDKRKAMRKGNYPLWPDEQTQEQRVELLTKAGALIAAEIDRILLDIFALGA